MNDKTESAIDTSSGTAKEAGVARIHATAIDGRSPKDPLSIQETVEHYLSAIWGINQTAKIALPHISKWAITEILSIQKKLEAFIPEIPEKGEGTKSFTLESARELAEFTNTIRQLDEIQKQDSTSVLSKSLFTQLFAEFDAYLGELLKIIYLKNDKLLKGISREITLSDLMDFDDLNAVKLSMLEKEIETFRRDSYIEQFSTLEKKFNLSLRKFKDWPEFIELSQRRNILTHNGGMVSDQYLSQCDREGYKFEVRPRIGDNLGVKIEYFASAVRLLSKVGLMLAYTLWSKVCPKELDKVHESLNNAIFRCLEQKRWVFVSQLEDFVLSDPMLKQISEVNYRIRVVNIAIGLKFAKKDVEAGRLLDSVDWSASYRDFKLAIAVLKECYDLAVEIMVSIGKTGEIIKQPDYHTWPLFTRFRERPEFYAAYFKVYGETFSEKVETSSGAVEAHAKSDGSIGKSDLNGNVVDVEAREVREESTARGRDAGAIPAAE